MVLAFNLDCYFFSYFIYLIAYGMCLILNINALVLCLRLITIFIFMSVIKLTFVIIYETMLIELVLLYMLKCFLTHDTLIVVS